MMTYTSEMTAARDALAVGTIVGARLAVGHGQSAAARSNSTAERAAAAAVVTVGMVRIDAWMGAR